VLAAIKLIPLGQQAGQRILFNLSQSIPSYVEAAFEIDDNAIGGSMPLWAIASSRHEIQYSRLFRS
jgi:urease accessory protein